MSGIIFFVCSTSWISRCSLAATSVIYFLIRSESRVPWQREDKKRHLVKVHRWQNQSQRVRRCRSRDPWIWCCTTRWMRGKPSARSQRSRQPGECRRETSRCSNSCQETDAEYKPRSNRVFSSEATGTHSNYTPLNQEDRDESSGSSARKLVREVNTKKEFHNMKITDHQNRLIWGLFKSSSMKAAVHLGPNYTENLEENDDTNFEEIQNLFDITQKLVSEHSEGILNVKTTESTSPSWTRSTMSHDQVIQWTKHKYVSTQTPYCLWGRCHLIQ